MPHNNCYLASCVYNSICACVGYDHTMNLRLFPAVTLLRERRLTDKMIIVVRPERRLGRLRLHPLYDAVYPSLSHPPLPRAIYVAENGTDDAVFSSPNTLRSARLHLSIDIWRADTVNVAGRSLFYRRALSLFFPCVRRSRVHGWRRWQQWRGPGGLQQY